VAGRTCYSNLTPQELWEKSATLSDEKMQKVVCDQIFDSGHLSVARHATLTFAISGISRAASHQLVRHHVGFDVEQQSQRYTPLDSNIDFVIPPTIESDPDAKSDYIEALYGGGEDLGVVQHYQYLVGRGIPGEDARFLLPNATPTNLVITVNLNSLITLCHERLCSLSQWEIRRTVAAMRREAVKAVPWIKKYLVIKCMVGQVCFETRNKDGHCTIRPHISNVDIVPKKVAITSPPDV
jgi:thymidylate synthase (FAD)